MSRSMKKSPLITLLVCIIAILLLSVLWSANKVGGYVGSVNIPRAYVCREIEHGKVPLPVTSKLYPDQRQICIWFEYKNAGKDDKIKIVCYRDQNEIIRQQVVPAGKNGIRAFYLVKNDGAALPVGKYRVTLSTATKSWNTVPETFEVVEKPVQVIPKSVVKTKEKIKTNPKIGGAKVAKKKKSAGNYRGNRRNRRR